MIEDFLHRLPGENELRNKFFLRKRCGSAVVEHLYENVDFFFLARDLVKIRYGALW